MKKTSLRILVNAKEVNKWIATKYVEEMPLQHSLLLYLEDKDY